MLSLFQSYILDNNLVSPGHKILLAVSGGIDSVVMLDLFTRSGYYCAIAHCNFKLRDEESDMDELFVRDLAGKYNIPFYTKAFNTADHADNNRISIQMAARELRYDWFEDLRNELHYDYIATAHNKNDAIETFFINLSRGTGIRGLSGITPKSGQILRPLLFLEREDIEEYAKLNEIPWREDSSNSQTKYARNKIRHLIIPGFQELNPGFINTMWENIGRLREIEGIYLHSLERTKKEILIKGNEFAWIPIQEISKLEPQFTWLFELLADFDFTAPVVRDISKNLYSTPGKQFFSHTHRLVKDRDKLIIHPLKDHSAKRYYIDDPSQDTDEPIHLELTILTEFNKSEIPKDPHIAWLDLDQLEFPLMIRKWETGDYFIPLGMNNMKKLSDFFIDNKFSLPEKENTWLLVSGGKIAWVIGERIDDRYKISQNTGRILQIRLN